MCCSECARRLFERNLKSHLNTSAHRLSSNLIYKIVLCYILYNLEQKANKRLNCRMAQRGAADLWIGFVCKRWGGRTFFVFLFFSRWPTRKQNNEPSMNCKWIQEDTWLVPKQNEADTKGIAKNGVNTAGMLGRYLNGRMWSGSRVYLWSDCTIAPLS